MFSFLHFELIFYIFCTNLLLTEPFVENAKEVFSTIASIIKLVKAVICHDWAKAEDLEPLISSAFTIIKRLVIL